MTYRKAKQKVRRVYSRGKSLFSGDMFKNPLAVGLLTGVAKNALAGKKIIDIENIKKLFPVGDTIVQRYLNTDLGPIQKYDLIVALWEGEKTIGKGIKYADFTVKNAVEKKKKIIVKMAISVLDHYPKTVLVD